MALILADRVQETTNTTGTGTLTLAGAVAGYQSFSAIGNANTTYYTIVSGTSWETGIGTYTSSGTTLSRDTVLASSASGAKISVAAGATVFCSYPASKAVYEDANNIANGFPISLPAGTATVAPLDFSAGTVNTTAQAGTMEYDGTTPYFSIAASTRGVLPTEQIIVLTSTNTLTSQTGVQPIFDGGGGPTNGQVTLPIGTYQFECMYAMTGMSTTSGSFGFSLGGGATKTFSYISTSSKASNTITTAQVTNQTFSTAANTALQTATTNSTGMALIKGTIRVTVAGTIIPQVSLTVASAAVVQAGSYFKVSPVGNATVATVGNWT
jgi:hypothetical protein